MAGMTEQGISIKRQREVLADLRTEAQPIFQDLVPPGDTVDTSNSSTIGRMTGLMSVPIADLWEAFQEVYLAFDPNSATGIALDNLVQYGGLSRNPASATTATVVVWGNEGTFIPAISSQVRSVDSNLYEVSISVNLDRTQNIGGRFGIASVVSGQTYSITISTQSTTATLSVVATPSSTVSSILTELKTQADTYSFLRTSETSTELTIETEDIYSYISLEVSNVIIQKIKTRTEVRNLEDGAVPQESNTISSIATPILGWDSVLNPFPAVEGRDAETDQELRNRFRDSKFLRAQNISDALYAALLEIDGVVNANVYENEGNNYDPVYDLPGHSFKAVVLGGNPTEIANAIWNNKPLGIASQGNTSVTIFDSQGFQKDVEFERPTSERIYIDINLTTNSLFPGSGEAEIRSALIEYFQNNFGIGEDVIYSRLYTPINTVAGHQVDSLYIGTTPNPTSTTNIPIAYNEISNLSTSDINIIIS